MLFYRRKSSGFVKTGNRKWFYFIKWYWDVREARGSISWMNGRWTEVKFSRVSQEKLEH